MDRWATSNDRDICRRNSERPRLVSWTLALVLIGTANVATLADTKAIVAMGDMSWIITANRVYTNCKDQCIAIYGADRVDSCNPCTRQALKDAVDDANTRVVVVIGHGGATEAVVQMSDEGYSASAFPRPHIRQVFFFSCSQVRDGTWQDWKATFPNANLWGYPKPINGHTLRFDSYRLGEWVNFYNSFGEDPEINFLSSTHDSLLPLPAEVELGGETLAVWATPMNPAFRLMAPLAQKLGTQRINLMARMKTSNAVEFLVGITAAQGVVTCYSDEPYKDVGFAITIPEDDYLACVEDPSTLDLAFDAGRVEITDFGAGLPDLLAYRAAAGLLFGIDATRLPHTDINRDCIVNSADLLSVIDGWGDCVEDKDNPCNCLADVTADHRVNVNDLLEVINSWGTGKCP